jgi:FkbM family methyltransferase
VAGAGARMTPAPVAVKPLYGWNWAGFLGSKAELRLNRRDLPNLDRAVALCPQRRVAVQAGGNLGLFPKRLAMRFETVYTFEPAADLFAIMGQNAPEPNILRYQAALGCRRELIGVTRVRRDGKKDTHEGCTHVSGPGNIPTLRIDDFNLPVCDLLCLDVEGYDLYALQGAVETLRRCRPVVSVEVNKNLGFVGLTPDDIRGYLAGHGYRFVARLESDEVFVPIEYSEQAA